MGDALLLLFAELDLFMVVLFFKFEFFVSKFVLEDVDLFGEPKLVDLDVVLLLLLLVFVGMGEEEVNGVFISSAFSGLSEVFALWGILKLLALNVVPKPC